MAIVAGIPWPSPVAMAAGSCSCFWEVWRWRGGPGNQRKKYLETSKNGEFQITIPTISFKSAPSIVQIFLVAKNTKKKCYLTIQPPKVVIKKPPKRVIEAAKCVEKFGFRGGFEDKNDSLVAELEDLIPIFIRIGTLSSKNWCWTRNLF